MKSINKKLLILFLLLPISSYIFTTANCAESANSVSHFNQNQTAIYWSKLQIDTPLKPIDFEVDDFDSDGDLDIFSFESHANRVLWYENKNKGLIWTKHIIEWNDDALKQVHGSYLIDMNGDGHKDIVVGSHEGNFIGWYDAINNWTCHTITRNSYGHEVAAADFDKDGDIDVVSVYHTPSGLYGVDLMMNPGNLVQENWLVYHIDSSLSGAFTVYTSDVNNDGYEDIIANSYSLGDIVWYENVMYESQQEKYRKHKITSFVDARESMPYDLDNDGDVDILTCDYGKKSHWWLPRWVAKVLTKIPGISHDFIRGNSGGRLLWYENIENGTKWREHVIDPNLAYGYVIEVADINKDGNPNIVVTSGRVKVGANARGSVQWYEAKDSNIFTPWAKYIIDTNVKYEARGIAIADFNLDGKMDIVVGYGGHEGEEGEVFLYLQQ